MRPHKNLIAWKESVELVQLVYKMCEKIPAEEKYSLISQKSRNIRFIKYRRRCCKKY
jgi:hypothetical protein